MIRIKHLLIIVLLLGFTVLANAQSYRNRQLSVIAFNLNVHQDLKLKFDQHSHLFKHIEKKKADNVIGAIKEHAWYLLKGRLEEGTGMYIFPLNAHGDRFSYDVYDFPEVSINRALRRGNSKYYLRIDLTITIPTSRRDAGYGSTTAPFDTASSETPVIEGSVVPEVSITVTTYRQTGVLPIQKVTGSAITNTPWLISEDTFNGIVNRKEFSKEDTSTLLGLIDLAIENLLKNF